MSQSLKQPPALVVIDGDLFHAFDRWRKLEGYNLVALDEADGWLLRLTRIRDDRNAQ
jgi:hypothetical protein